KKAYVDWPRAATSEEQFAKEMLSGELEALKEDLGRMSKIHQQSMEEVMNVQLNDLALVIPLKFQFQVLKYQTKTWKTNANSIRSYDSGGFNWIEVMRNERMDGNPPGSPPYEAARRLHRYRVEEQRPYFIQKANVGDAEAWYSLDEQGWRCESDNWEEVSKDVIIRIHAQPRQELCHPNKVGGALMPRRLKYRCNYMVDEMGNVHTSQDNWVRKGKKGRKSKTSWTGFTAFCNKPVDLEAFAGGKPRGQGEIFDHEIKPEEREGWRETDLQEWNKVASTGAIRVLSLSESQKVRKEFEKSGKSNQIIPSRMVRRMKPAEQPGEPATRKSRWCLRGDKDPDPLSLERFSPTLCSATFGVLLQACATLRYEASVGDLKNAFCQSLPLNREGGPIYATLPKGGIAGLHQDQLIQILVGCYGLPDAPMHWRRSLKESILALGYKESVRAIAVEVDDLFNFGSKLRYDRMKQLQEKYKFSKFEMIPPAKNGVGFNGRRIRQLKDYSFVVDMEKFVTERLEPIQMAKGRKSNPKALATDSEIAQMRAVVGSLNWASREERPDASASASLSALKFPKPVVQDLIDLNKSIQMIKSRPDLNIKIRSIPADKLAWGVMTDASFDNAGDGKSQGAYGVLAFHEDLQKGYRVPCSLVTWRSGRIQRVVNSTLAAETQSLSKGLGELCWIKSVFNEIMNPHFKIENWETEMENNKVLAMAPDSVSTEFKKAICIIDAKALYDHLSRESVGPSQAKRTSLEIQVVRQNMNAINGKIRWIPHPHMAMGYGCLDEKGWKHGGSVRPAGLRRVSDRGGSSSPQRQESRARPERLQHTVEFTVFQKQSLGSCDLYSVSSSWKDSCKAEVPSALTSQRGPLTRLRSLDISGNAVKSCVREC
ncbi:RE1, partial [Symbiodinium sp. CCMP2456]